MKASFIIGFHTKRMDNLAQTLRFLRKNHSDVIKKCELIMVCQDMCYKSWPVVAKGEWAKDSLHNLELPCMQLPYVTNFGVNKATSDKIIILESDRILPAGYFESVIDQLEEGIQITTKNMLKLAKETSDEEIVSGIFESKEEHRSDTNEIGLRNMWSGNTAFMKSDFDKSGRMDEAYTGYGWADSDMTYTMENIGVKSIYRDELEYHLWHPSATYGDGDQKQMFIDNGMRICKKWGKSQPDWFRNEIRQHRAGRMIL